MSDEQQSLGELFATASKDLSTLVRSEVALAKAELKADVVHAATGGAMFGVAGYLGFLASILLSFAAVYGLVAAGLNTAVSFLIISGAYLLLGGVLALVGKRQVAKANGTPVTSRTVKATAAWAKKPRIPA